MLLKFEIIWKKTGQLIRLENDIDFSEIPCTSKIISKFFKHPVYKCFMHIR